MRSATLNHVYRLVWNIANQLWIPVAETSRHHGKSGKSRAVALLGTGILTLFIGSQASALPNGGVVSSGSGQISQTSSQLTVSQQSQNLAVNWQSFDIASNQTVTFNQPNTNAIALNRVLGQNSSSILGKLNSNGQVFLINPNGILFGQSAQVSVGGLVATTLNLSDADFNQGIFNFSGGSTASVVNNGKLSATTGGYVALLGASVSNANASSGGGGGGNGNGNGHGNGNTGNDNGTGSGNGSGGSTGSASITALQGNVSLAAGQQVTLQLANGSLVGLTVTQGAINAVAQNSGLIQANGGQVLLTAEAANALATAVVNNTGVIEAKTVANHNGQISLIGDMDTGTVNVGGTLNASAPTAGNGGLIETSANTVNLATGVVITAAANSGTAGTWILDPNVITINTPTANILNSVLNAGTNVTVRTMNTGALGNGDININAGLSWNSNKILTLSAYNSINLNAPITVTGAGTLSLTYNNQLGGSNTAGNLYFLSGNISFTNVISGITQGALSINDQPYTLVNSVNQLTTNATNNPSGFYALANNYNAFSDGIYASAPISHLDGTFNGLGNAISNLVISSSDQNVGLFGQVSSTGQILNLGLLGGSVTGLATGGDIDFSSLVNVGALVGHNLGRITNVYATGSVSATGNYSLVGGLIGLNNGGTITNSYASGTVLGVMPITATGGLVGANLQEGNVTNSYATGAVSGGISGGLVGINNNSLISNSYATGAITGGAFVGGLSGANFSGTISDSYATGTVTGGDYTYVGGLVGFNDFGLITGSYATGTVTGGDGAFVGALVGFTTP